jgi:hypothetical protein
MRPSQSLALETRTPYDQGQIALASMSCISTSLGRRFARLAANNLLKIRQRAATCAPARGVIRPRDMALARSFIRGIDACRVIASDEENLLRSGLCVLCQRVIPSNLASVLAQNTIQRCLFVMRERSVGPTLVP